MTIAELVSILRREALASGRPLHRVLLSAGLDASFFTNYRKNEGVRLDSLLSICRVLNITPVVGQSPILNHAAAIATIDSLCRASKLQYKQMDTKAGYAQNHFIGCRYRGTIRLQTFINYLQVFNAELTLARITYEKLQ